MIRTALTAALILITTPATARFVSPRITVTTQGTGPDVILVPGLTSSPAAFKYVAQDLPGYRYHFIQVKGFAGVPAEANASGPVAAPVAEEIARYITAEHLKAPAIVGHSMGGTIAMMVAARHPGSVGKLMVVDMPPFLGQMFGGPNATSASVKPIADGMMAGWQKSTPEARRAASHERVAQMVNTAAELPQITKSADDSDEATVMHSYGELIVTDLRPELANVSAPSTVLYVTPKGAPLTDAQIDAVYAASYANLKGAKLTRIPDSAHFIMYDARPRFAIELKTFLTAN
ncbi:Putative hydrolase [Sphingomonas antarctica]|uniref:alpha/beta fold hydrolase n=1 Tax=Sphingomonas antarctica TaxID=2040274 RepID=UPI0039EC77CA